jgi:hypothetical protein
MGRPAKVGSVVQCQRCGAALDLAVANCPYCGTLTAHGYAMEQQRAAQSYHAQTSADFARANERLRAEDEVKKQARIGLITSIVGFFICCAPVTVAGLVLSLRAKSNARRFGIIAPASSTFGLILGIFGSLSTVGTWLGAFVFSPSADERRAELERRAAEATLTSSMACELVDQRLESRGFGNEKNIYTSTCNGRLAQRDNKAFLDGVRFHAEGKYVDASVCFTRGARWEISDVRADQQCAPPR